MPTAAIYLRVSLDPTNEKLAVERQEEDCRAIAAARGWEVIEPPYTDNSISASDAGKVRPAYDHMIKDYEAGRFDALICWDLDRLTRQPRQLEDWIDRAEQRGLLLLTANGEADLTTDGGRMYARIKAAVARAEVERKSARQKRARLQSALKGRAPSGSRLTGYLVGGSLHPTEAEIVREIFDRFAAGDTIRGIANDLTSRGVPTRMGGSKWSSATIGTILRNPRYAGFTVYQGEIMDAAEEATWEPLVSRDKFQAIQSRMDDPRRKSNASGDTARKHLGSGLYFCGAEGCGRRVSTDSGPKGNHRYACREKHFHRAGPPIDDFVIRVVRGRLGMPDLHELLVKPAEESRLKELNEERANLAARLVSIAGDYDTGLIDGQRYRVATEKVKVQLTEIDRERMILVSKDGLGGILNTPDPVAAFDRSPRDIQRRIVDALLEITLLPARPGVRFFDPSSVRLTWR